MIARTWRGATRAADAEVYLEYLHRTGIRGFRETPGNQGSLVLRRIVDDRAEFLMISFWDSEESIQAFAGEDISAARFYPEDVRHLVERDMHVDHYQVVSREREPRAVSREP